MPRVDRRITKSQEAIKKAFIELMSEKNFDQITVQDISDKENVGRRTIYHHYQDKFDLLSKLIEEHISELRKLCESAAINTNVKEANLVWFKYFESNYLFFSTMLTGQGTFAFRNQFLQFVIEELKERVDISRGKNKGLNEDVILRFLGSAIVGIVESYFTEDIPKSTEMIAEQAWILLDRNL
ncbi:TetR/AcrR family transcriptional regulator [Paenibacillus polymyxa]|uniref:TetR/AcrR family transcriptional regulator n=1 Tax=Paenibacillus polymyxa TaxID=1406 RepID=UPI0021E4B735|nr:TetR/AcrR family transcriptional regulator [Paenibacillus polymyxa]